MATKTTPTTHLRAEEAAVLMGVSINTIYNYRNAGLLHQEQVGTKKMFVRSEVLELKSTLIKAGALRETADVAA